MTAVITADIVNSRKLDTQWMDTLRSLLEQRIPNRDWAIFRGDSFQIELPAKDAFRLGLLIKSRLSEIEVGVRMAIGLGETNTAEAIGQRSGSAFVRSGESFELLKPNKRLWSIASGNSKWDDGMNLILDMASALIETWQPLSAELVRLVLEHPKSTQETLGKHLGIAQAAVSRRRSRSHLDLLLKVETHYLNALNDLP